MGSVLAFPPRSAASNQKQTATGISGSSFSGSIVIFPGVRYERREEMAQDALTSRGEARGEKPQPRH